MSRSASPAAGSRRAGRRRRARRRSTPATPGPRRRDRPAERDPCAGARRAPAPAGRLRCASHGPRRSRSAAGREPGASHVPSRVASGLADVAVPLAASRAASAATACAMAGSDCAIRSSAMATVSMRRGASGTNRPATRISVAASRARKPSTSSDGASAIAPSIGTRPASASRPVTPQQWAGMRNDPAVSEPMAKSTSPAATATPEPEEEPPQMRGGSQGLSGRCRSGLRRRARRPARVISQKPSRARRPRRALQQDRGVASRCRAAGRGQAAAGGTAAACRAGPWRDSSGLRARPRRRWLAGSTGLHQQRAEPLRRPRPEAGACHGASIAACACSGRSSARESVPASRLCGMRNAARLISHNCEISRAGASPAALPAIGRSADRALGMRHADVDIAARPGLVEPDQAQSQRLGQRPQRRLGQDADAESLAAPSGTSPRSCAPARAAAAPRPARAPCPTSRRWTAVPASSATNSSSRISAKRTASAAEQPVRRETRPAPAGPAHRARVVRPGVATPRTITPRSAWPRVSASSVSAVGRSSRSTLICGIVAHEARRGPAPAAAPAPSSRRRPAPGRARRSDARPYWRPAGRPAAARTAHSAAW